MKFRHLLLAVAAASQLATAAPPETHAVEFFNTNLQHYFITADANEALGIENGNAGSGWIRTGRSFGAWLNPDNAPAGAAAVCRFYSTGANSHFFTANAAECASLKALEGTQRLAAVQLGQLFTGWTFEGVAFTAAVPAGAAATQKVAGACPGGTEDIFRAYNNGFATGQGANHRFVNDATLRDLMIDRGWTHEGVAFCAPVQGSGTSAPSTPSGGSFPELAAIWTGPSQWEFRALPGGARSEIPATLSVAITDIGALSGSGNGCTLSGALTQVDGFRVFYIGAVDAAACADTRFNGSYPLRIERLGSSQLQFHFGQESATREIEVEAFLSAATAPPPLPPPASGAATWVGTVAWISTQKNGGTETIIASVNQPLSLTLDGTALSGTGFDCTFAGTLQAGAGGALTGTVTATGCLQPSFNGSYSQVTLRRESGNALEVELEKETQSGQTSVRAKIHGVLFGQNGTPPPSPPPPPPPAPAPGFVLAGTWGANDVTWTVITRQGGNPDQTVAGTHALALTISSGNGVTGSGFGCSFTGSVQQPVSSVAVFVASLQASGCSNPAFNGSYSDAGLHASNGALELQVEREIEGGGLRTRVRIEGVLRK